MTDRSKITDVYLDLLKKFYDKGLRLSFPQDTEVLSGAEGRSAQIPPNPMICYTELRLSSVQEHSKRYGALGIGFDRQWLINHGAIPVIYVPNIDGGVVNTNLVNRIIPESANKPYLHLFLTFLKLMSRDKNQKNLDFYDEMEWRMVSWTLHRGNDPVPVPGPDWMPWDPETGHSYFKFQPSDVAIIVTPDEGARKAILTDSDMVNKYFNSHLPMMVDADRCDQF